MKSENTPTQAKILDCSLYLDTTQPFTENVIHSIALALIAEQLNGGTLEQNSLYCEMTIIGLQSVVSPLYS
jgi:hypothetical protein